MRPAVNKSVLIPSPRIAFFQVSPPSSLTNIPPAIIRTFNALFDSSETVIPVLSQVTA